MGRSEALRQKQPQPWLQATPRTKQTARWATNTLAHDEGRQTTTCRIRTSTMYHPNPSRSSSPNTSSPARKIDRKLLIRLAPGIGNITGLLVSSQARATS